MTKIKTYQEAFEELKIIVQKMENAEIPVDELSIMIKKATELITICKKKLTETEEEVKSLLEKL